MPLARKAAIGHAAIGGHFKRGIMSELYPKITSARNTDSADVPI